MRRRRTWAIGILAIVAIWALALAAMAIARGREVTVASVVRLVRERPLARMRPDERLARVEALAARVNRLSFEQRRDSQLQAAVRDAFRAMDAPERSRYIDLTLPPGLKQMMQAINEMPRDERRRLVEEAVDGMRDRGRHRGDVLDDREIPQETRQRIIDEGLKSYLRDASAEAKLDLQPLIEQMQRYMQKLDR